MRQADPAQTELVFATPAAAPLATAEDVERLVDLLRGRGWVSAAELSGIAGQGLSDRKIRAIARAAAPGVVSYPGSPGYKLWDECSVEEINHAIEAFESQARDMTARAILYRQAYHARHRGLSAS